MHRSRGMCSTLCARMRFVRLRMCVPSVENSRLSCLRAGFARRRAASPCGCDRSRFSRPRCPCGRARSALRWRTRPSRGSRSRRAPLLEPTVETPASHSSLHHALDPIPDQPHASVHRRDAGLARLMRHPSCGELAGVQVSLRATASIVTPSQIGRWAGERAARRFSSGSRPQLSRALSSRQPLPRATEPVPARATQGTCRVNVHWEREPSFLLRSRALRRRFRQGAGPRIDHCAGARSRAGDASARLAVA